MEALELHAARIFDDEGWCDFVPFNEKYRPATLEEVEFISIINECCNKPGELPLRSLNKHTLAQHAVHIADGILNSKFI